MKIGTLVLETGTVDPTVLRSGTGCTPARMLRLLERPLLASTLAVAVQAVAPGAPPRHDLARLLALEPSQADQVREQLREIYGASQPADAGTRQKRGRKRAKAKQ